MLLATKDETLTTGGLKETTTFTIKAGPKAFDILSSNLYQNKVLAVIREISCNAADAHKMVGKDTSTIQVTLPTFGSPIFKVRDFGPSMSHDQIMRLYTSYFDSTKDGSNDAIGGFGLGSKSPFSITDQFTVTAWQAGVRRDYAMYKVDGVPTVSLTSERPSADPTGIEVSVAVGTTDMRRWHDEAISYFKWWRLPPRLLGNSVNITSIWAPPQSGTPAPVSSTTLVDGLPSWSMRSPTGGPLVFMGLVPYTLNLTALGKIDADVVEMFTSMPVVLVYNIGDLEISPSRETLSYNPATCAALIARLKDVAKHVFSAYKDRITKAPSLYEARHLLYGHNNVFGSQQRLRQSFLASKPTWGGYPIQHVVKLDLTTIADDCRVTTYSRSYYGTTYRRRGEAEDTCIHRVSDYGEDTTLYVHAANITAKTYSAIKHYIDTKNTGGVRKAPGTFMIVSGSDFATVRAAFQKAGMPPIEDLSTWPVPARAAPGTSNRAVTRGYERTGFVVGTSPGAWEAKDKELDLKGGGYYVPFFDGEPADMAFNRIFSAGCHNELKTVPNIIGLPKRILDTKKWQDILATNGWKCIDDPSVWDLYKPEPILKFMYLRGLFEAKQDMSWLTIRAMAGYITGRMPSDMARLGIPTLSTTVATWDFIANSDPTYLPSVAGYVDAHFPYPQAVRPAYDTLWSSMKPTVDKDAAALGAFFDKHPLLKVAEVWRDANQNRIALSDLIEYTGR